MTTTLSEGLSSTHFMITTNVPEKYLFVYSFIRSLFYEIFYLWTIKRQTFLSKRFLVTPRKINIFIPTFAQDYLFMIGFIKFHFKRFVKQFFVQK